MQLLESLRHPFKNDFVKHVSMLGASTASIMLIGMINMMIVVRYLSKDELGIFIMMEIMVEFLAVFSHAGADIALTQILATSAEDDKPSISSTALVFRGLTLLCIFIVFIPSKSFFFMLSGSQEIQGGTLYIFLLLFVYGYRDLLRLILEGYFRFESIMRIDITISLVNLLIVTVFVVLLKMNLAGIIYARVFSSLIGCFFLYQAIPGKKIFTFRFDHLKKVIKIGFPLQLNDITAFFSSRLGAIIVASMLGPASLASLEIAQKVPAMLRRFFQSFRSVYLPNLSQLSMNPKTRIEASLLMNRSLLIIMVIFGTAAVLTSLFAGQIITILFSDKYLSAINIFIISMISVQFGVAGNILGTSLVAMGETKSATKVNIVGSVFALPFNFIIIPLWGAIGVPVVEIIGSCFGVCGNSLFLHKKLVKVQFVFLLPVCITTIVCLLAFIFPTDKLWYKALSLLMYVACNLSLYFLTPMKQVIFQRT